MGQIFRNVEQSIHNLGFESFAIVIFLFDGVRLYPVCLTNFSPSWQHQYKKQNYIRRDPILQLTKGKLTLTWKELLEHLPPDSEETKIFTEARKHGLKDGGTISFDHPGCIYSFISVAVNNDVKHFSSLFYDRVPALTPIAKMACDMLIKH